ncbi:MAG: DUF1592 domain-containing protein [Gemmatimonadetes bacterium]|nr:DUF1592 domain-containing protein [Gemmatimonadota bacterium]
MPPPKKSRDQVLVKGTSKTRLLRARGGHASVLALVLGGVVSIGVFGAHSTASRLGQAAEASADPQEVREILDRYCVACHSETLRSGGLAFDVLDVENPADDPQAWERAIRRLRTGTMPPGGVPRPDEAGYEAVATWLENEIDREWTARPNPGRVGAVHRLNRLEYNNAVRDLFGLDVDVTSLLPGDETADGSFDNFADVLSISTAHMQRYMSVARQVTRLATGLPPENPVVETFEVPLHVVQDQRQSEDLPFGSRGGIAVPFNFPVDGEYVIKVRLRTNWQDYVMGMGWAQQVEVRLDGGLLRRFTIGGEAPGNPAPMSFTGPGERGDPEWEVYMRTADEELEVRIPVEAGPRIVGVSFVREMWEPGGVPQPIQRGRLLANDDLYMDYQSIHSVEIGGPYQVTGPASDTDSRAEIFVCHPDRGAEEEACASEILGRLARRAYRRPVTGQDVQTLLGFFHEGLEARGSFDAGIQFALEFLLSDPDFLLRVTRDPEAAGAGEVYRLSDLDVASRLSFFLWSSIPDEELLDLAERGQLANPEVREEQVRRMLADPRAVSALVDGFAAQWLNVRRVGEVVVDPLVYPNFDESLLEAFQRETELFVGNTLREDRSVLELLTADYTYVNERLARHYGFPGIYGSRFRRITLPDLEQRGGLLAQGGLLAATSYPGRTSPVLRGKWLLDNVLGSPPPAPPANVPEFPENEPGTTPKSVRERLELHRADFACATCHATIDPLGFALENFDAIGGWRTVDESGNPIDALGSWPGGRELHGFSDLRAMLVDPPERFVGTVTEKLMSYALGRRLEYYDRPAVRRIVQRSKADDYRWSSIILGIVESPSFLMSTASGVD